MEAVAAATLFVAAIGVVIVLASSAVNGLIAFLGILLLYPDYLRVSLGSIDISAARIVVTLLLVRCFSDSKIMSQFRWKPLDTLVVLSMAIYSLALIFTTDVLELLENRAGFVMDTLFVYFAVRFVVVDRKSLVSISKAIAVMTVALAAHGLIETFTGKSLYTGLGQYCPWADSKGMEYQTRYGLNRAMGPPGETILFGLSFASFVPLIWLLRHEPAPWNRWAYPLTLAGMAGVASTVSSGPYMAMIVIAGCLLLEYFKFMVKPLIALFILFCLAVEVFSNRHFYHVVADFTMDPASGWYRARLIDVAIMKLPDYWLYGYGFVDPGWGPLINSLKRTDVVNDFVLHAILYGFFGLLAYCAILGRAAYDAVQCYRLAPSPWMRSCAWALLSSLVGLFFASWSVAMFGQMTSQLYFLVGLLGALAPVPKALRASSAVAGRAIPMPRTATVTAIPWANAK